MSIDDEIVLKPEIYRTMSGHLLKIDIINLIYYMSNRCDLHL